MKNITIYLIILLSFILHGGLYAYSIRIINNSPIVIQAQVWSATYEGFAMLADAGTDVTKEFGASCPWEIQVSDFFTPPNILKINLHYGDKVEEQCRGKTLTITYDEGRKALKVYTDVWAHDGSRGYNGWRNEWEKTYQPLNPQFKAKL